MTVKQNPYKILGISPDSSDSEVKKAFNKLAKQYHPDINSDEDAEKRMRIIRKAYEFIVKKRKSSLLSGDFSSVESKSSLSVFKTSVDENTNFRKSKTQYHVFKSDILSAKKGGDYSDLISVTDFCEYCSGTGVEESLYDNNMCYDCSGSGYVKSSYGVMRVQKKCDSCMGSGVSAQKSCSHCMGKGEVKRNKSFSFTLPEKTHSGYQLCLPPVLGDAQEGQFDQLILSIHVNGVDGIELDDDGYLYLEKYIDYIQYLIGGRVYIDELEKYIVLDEGDNSEESFTVTLDDDNKYETPVVIQLQIGKIEDLKSESISDLRSWYQRFYK